MNRRTLPFALACALFCAMTPSLYAQGQTAPATSPPPTIPANPAPAPAAPGTPPPASPATPATTPPETAPPPAWPAAGVGTLPGNRITGIETNREMIAAEAPTEIVINGTPDAKCGVAIDFGDGARAVHSVSETAPFPLRLTHTYPKMASHTIRVAGAANAGFPPCEGAADVAIRVSPAGSKIEYVTLSINSCPEGWTLFGQVAADKSFKCSPVPDRSAPTNLIHCTDGMKYFARGGNVGCAHPVAAAQPGLAAAPPAMKGRMHGKGPGKGGHGMSGPMKSSKPSGQQKPKATQPNAKAAAPS